MNEETIINLLLDLTINHNLLWCNPVLPDGTELGGTYERYSARITHPENFTFIVGKSIIIDDLYTLVCFKGDTIFFSLVSKEMKNKYLLQSLYDTASEVVKRNALNRLGEILQGQINNSHAQTDLKSSSDDNTKPSS